MATEIQDQHRVLAARLRMVLMANEVVVAESSDEFLWQSALAAITSGKPTLPNTSKIAPGQLREGQVAGPTNSAIEHFAAAMGTNADVVIGACAPSTTEPYLHLDSHCWEALKKNTPSAGRGAISPIKMAGTLLVLWFKYARLGNPTLAQIQNVLDTISLRDVNPSRGIKKAEWLQSRGGSIHLNPAATSQALDVARAYCTKTPPTA